MSGGCERRGGLGSLIASSNYTKKRAPRSGCRESRVPLACGLHGATLDPRPPACVQPVDQRVGRLDRRGGRDLDRVALLPDPDPDRHGDRGGPPFGPPVERTEAVEDRGSLHGDRKLGAPWTPGNRSSEPVSWYNWNSQ